MFFLYGGRKTRVIPQCRQAWLFCTFGRKAIFVKQQNNFHGNRLSGIRRTKTKVPHANSVFMWCLSHCLLWCKGHALPADSLPSKQCRYTLHVCQCFSLLKSSLILSCKGSNSFSGAIRVFLKRFCWVSKQWNQRWWNMYLGHKSWILRLCIIDIVLSIWTIRRALKGPGWILYFRGSSGRCNRLVWSILSTLFPVETGIFLLLTSPLSQIFSHLRKNLYAF